MRFLWFLLIIVVIHGQATETQLPKKEDGVVLPTDDPNDPEFLAFLEWMKQTQPTTTTHDSIHSTELYINFTILSVLAVSATLAFILLIGCVAWKCHSFVSTAPVINNKKEVLADELAV